EALASRRAALAIRQKLADRNPDAPALRRGIAQSLNNIGDLQIDSGDSSGAIVTFERARELSEELLARYPGVGEYISGLGFSLSGLGGAHRRAGRAAEAATLLRRSIALWEGLPGQSSEAHGETARNHALLAGLASEPGTGLSPADGLVEARNAIEALGRA